MDFLIAYVRVDIIIDIEYISTRTAYTAYMLYLLADIEAWVRYI